MLNVDHPSLFPKLFQEECLRVQWAFSEDPTQITHALYVHSRWVKQQWEAPHLPCTLLEATTVPFDFSCYQQVGWDGVEHCMQEMIHVLQELIAT